MIDDYVGILDAAAPHFRNARRDNLSVTKDSRGAFGWSENEHFPQ